jgi:hypothetical protein
MTLRSSMSNLEKDGLRKSISEHAMASMATKNLRLNASLTGRSTEPRLIRYVNYFLQYLESVPPEGLQAGLIQSFSKAPIPVVAAPSPAVP